MTRRRYRTIAAAAALGAASVFLPHWDPDEHWATPQAAAVTIVDQLDDDDWVDAPPHHGTLADGRTWRSAG